MIDLTFKIITSHELAKLFNIDYNLCEILLHSPYIYTKQHLENYYNGNMHPCDKIKNYDSKYFESYFESLTEEDNSYARLGLYNSYESVNGKNFFRFILIRLIYEKILKFDNYIIAESVDSCGIY